MLVRWVLGVFIPTAIAWLGVLIFQRVYKDAPISKRRLFTNIITANLVGVTIFVLIFFFNRDIFFSRLILAYVWGISNILLIANAWAFRLIKFHSYKKGLGTKKTLIVGANKVAEEVIKNFQTQEPFYEPVAILDAYGTKKKKILGVPVLGKMNSLEDVLKEQNIKAIAQADCIEQSVNLVQICEKNNLDYFLSPNLFGAYHANISSEYLGKLPFVSLRSK
jgi:FlaA1/EpsC-like NDP-sugar epimerase